MRPQARSSTRSMHLGGGSRGTLGWRLGGRKEGTGQFWERPGREGRGVAIAGSPGEAAWVRLGGEALKLVGGPGWGAMEGC